MIYVIEFDYTIYQSIYSSMAQILCNLTFIKKWHDLKQFICNSKLCVYLTLTV